MILRVDKEAKEIIVGLCDIALKAGGLNNYKAVGVVLNSMGNIEEGRGLDSIDGDVDENAVMEKEE